MKEQNYFIINNYSGYWKDATIAKNDQSSGDTYESNIKSISLQPHSSYKLKKILDLDLEDQESKPRDNSKETITEDSANIYSIDFDGS